jgi:hypothetical protein
MPAPALWENASAFAAPPIAVWITALGLGLLVERVARVRLANALLIPLGYCVAVVVCLGVYTTGAGDPVVLPLLCVLVLAGFASQWGRLRSRLNPGWPALAALAAYLLFDASVIGTGHWTFTGYHLQDDTAYEMLLVEHLKVYGTHLGALPPSTARSYIASFLSTGYPLGTQSYLAALSGLVHTEVAVIWQGYLSSLAAVGAMAAATLSGRTLDRRLGALVGFMAMSAALTYQYALQGSIKEVGVTVAVLCALALMRFAILELRGPGATAICAIPLAATLATYNAAGLPYAAALAGSGVAAILLVHRRAPSRAWVGPAAVGVAVFAVCALPVANTILTFLRVASALYTGPHAAALPLGQLLRPLPLSESVGVWLAGDYRVMVAPGLAGNLEVAATVAILALLLPGVGLMLRRREPGGLMGLLSVGLVLLIVYPKAIPYAQGKLLAIGSPVIVVGAAQGLAALRARRLVPLAALLGGALGVGVLASDVLAYHHDPVAPTGRLLALRQVGAHLRGDRGPVLASEFEEFAKYFTFPARVYAGTEYPTPENVALIAPEGIYDQSFDLDQEQLAFVESFPTLLVRRSPAASRPPANYRRAYENGFYEIWRRTPLPHVLAHLPLQRLYHPDAPVGCAALGAMVRGAPPASRLIVAQSPASVGYEVLHATVRSPGWISYPNADTPDAVTPLTPGSAGKVVTVARTGNYRVWVQGTFPRALRVTLDGRTIGVVAGENSPDEWLEGGAVHVSAGRHALDLFRGGGDLAPGDGGTEANEGKGEIGYVALVAEEPERLRTLAPGAWHTLCGRLADWVELVRG